MHLPAQREDVGLVEDQSGGTPPARAELRGFLREGKHVIACIGEETVQRAKDFDVAWTRAIVKFKAGMVDGLSELSRAFGEFWTNVVDDIPGGNFIRDAMDKWAG